MDIEMKMDVDFVKVFDLLDPESIFIYPMQTGALETGIYIDSHKVGVLRLTKPIMEPMVVAVPLGTNTIKMHVRGPKKHAGWPLKKS